MKRKGDRKVNRMYRRSLPHILPEKSTLFFTYNLDGTLPKSIVEQLRSQQKINELEIKKLAKNEADLEKRIIESKQIYFGKYDHLLHSSKSGPTYLAKPAVADLVRDSIMHLAQAKYHLICFTIMPNHVHKIVTEKQEFIGHLMQSHKGYTGRLANKILGRRGRFWQRESFDTVIRGDEHLFQKVQYVMRNPVKAGYIKDYFDWAYSYIHPDYKWIMEK